MAHNHYEQAAANYADAARNLLEAHNKHQDGNDEKASHFAYIALGHRIIADEHMKEASKQYASENNSKTKSAK